MHRKTVASTEIVAMLYHSDEMGSPDKGVPYSIIMLQDGGCVTSGNSPFTVYYPTWEMVVFFTGANLSHYKPCYTPRFEWDVLSTEYGPMG